MFGLGRLGDLGLIGGALDGWVLSSGGTQATLDLNFVGNLAKNGTSFPAISSILSCTRATPAAAYYANADGTLTSFGANVLRYGTNGLLVEESRVNVVLWSRDMTNVAWTKTNCTAALDQTGNDGTVNGASSLLATGANATCLQAITLASSARFQSVWAKRLVGSGTINMTLDNGVTWTPIVLTAAWQQLTVPTQTLANPTVGFRIVTNGDKIAVDFVQNENGAFVTSPVPTTTVAVTRAADVVTTADLLFLNVSAGVIYSAFNLAVGTTGDRGFVGRQLGGATTAFYLNGSATAADWNNSVLFQTANSYTLGTNGKAALSYDAGNRSLVLNGSAVATNANGIGTFDTFRLGMSAAGDTILNGYIQRLAYWNSRLSDGAIQTLTT